MIYTIAKYCILDIHKMYEALYICIILFLADRKFKTSAFSLPHMELLSVF